MSAFEARLGVAWQNDDGSVYVKLHGTQLISGGFVLYPIGDEDKAGSQPPNPPSSAHSTASASRRGRFHMPKFVNFTALPWRTLKCQICFIIQIYSYKMTIMASFKNI